MPGGFYKLYADEFRKRIRDVYMITRIPEDREPVEAHRLRVATDNTAARAAFAFPDSCPEKPHSIQPVVEEFDNKRYNQFGIPRGHKIVKYRIGTEVFEVSIA